MGVLNPSQAAAIASGVYQLRESSVTELHEIQAPLGCEGMFAVADNGRFTGRSGGGPFKKISGFGYVAAGEGAFAGEVLISTRGTAQTADWLSNLNIGMQLGPSSHLVHAGFHEVWKSFKQEIFDFLRNRNPSRIHCVGHSLGGALAMLNADALSAQGLPVSLYTFGAPRTGDVFFSRSMTKRLGADHIHRVSATSDPVPMIPLFPFCHMPFDGAGNVIQSTGLISVAAHNMKRSYIPGVRDRSWQTLADENHPDEEQNVKSWLEQAAEGKGSILMGSASALTMIGKGLRWLLARLKDLLVGAVGVTLAVSATLLDQLAWLLAKGAAASKEVAGQVTGLMKAIFRFLGRVTMAVTDLTVGFLRWVLDLLFSSVRVVAERALAFLN
ncbi:lipase family protein [Roseateles saccharophilus]|uniref:Lipase (Class 3) n=1 Tax=Roseateles saccharophilus TaxID=304 RepID=A0A4R3UVV1_ROSSA|nr:lipase family protein [Roseateles saccharophilus]MDG0833097.1 lipase family protein [Roseateles saccharophilus]TCU96296.1 lipase (class 3) [Roseateles saccharophilus]